jgi:LacI family transcriptional regulator
MRRLTLDRIAKLADVSKSTASRVLNGQDGVRPEVRRRVLDVIESTGYMPHAAARSLAASRSGILGIAIPERAEQIFVDPYFGTLVEGALAACNDRELTLALFLFQDTEDGAQLPPRVLGSRLVDGLIVTATFIDDPLIGQILGSDLPFVLVGEHAGKRVTTVDADNEAGAHAAVRHLLDLGHRRIAAVMGPVRNAAVVARRRGYDRALADRGLAVDPSLIVETDFDESAAYRAAVPVVARRPDAIFAFSDAMALGVLRAVRDAGLRVPEDIALVGFDDLPIARSSDPPLTTVCQHVERAGAMAVELLAEQLDADPPPAPRKVVLPTELVVRASTGERVTHA